MAMSLNKTILLMAATAALIESNKQEVRSEEPSATYNPIPTRKQRRADERARAKAQRKKK